MLKSNVRIRRTYFEQISAISHIKKGWIKYRAYLENKCRNLWDWISIWVTDQA